MQFWIKSFFIYPLCNWSEKKRKTRSKLVLRQTFKHCQSFGSYSQSKLVEPRKNKHYLLHGTLYNQHHCVHTNFQTEIADDVQKVIKSISSHPKRADVLGILYPISTISIKNLKEQDIVTLQRLVCCSLEAGKKVKWFLSAVLLIATFLKKKAPKCNMKIVERKEDETKLDCEKRQNCDPYSKYTLISSALDSEKNQSTKRIFVRGKGRNLNVTK